MKNERLAQYIDHTLLKATATAEQITKLCEEAIEYNFKTVCVNPDWVSFSANLLKGSPVGVTTVVGFPLGATTTETKKFETQQAIENGADEIDMVINIGRLRCGDIKSVRHDIAEVKEACKDRPLKVILETCLLSDQEIMMACQLAVEGKADFVKTSTGFSTGGATSSAVGLMRKTVGHNFGVKASGDVRSREDAEAIIKAGANRIGTSSGVAILQGDEVIPGDGY